MPNTATIPQRTRPGGYREERHNVAAHAGRLRATVRALVHDMEYVLDDVPVELHDRVRAVFNHDVRRARQILEEVIG